MTLTHQPETSWELVTPRMAPRRQAERLAGEWLATYSNELTRRNRRQTIKQFFAYLDELGVVDPVHEVRRGHIDTWLRKLEAEGNKASTVAQKIAGVGRYYRYLHREEYIDRDPSLAVERPRVSKESTRDYMTEREIADVLTEAEHEGGYPHLLIALLMYNAFRISEITTRDLSDLGHDRHHTTLLVVRKGGKAEIVPLPGPTVTILKAAIGDRTEGPLLLNRKGTRMQREAAAVIIRRLCRKARVTKNITPHSYRHSGATSLRRAGVPIEDVAEFMGHEDIRTTKRYDRMVRQLDAHRSYSLVPIFEQYR